MSNSGTFIPNWASAPGETLADILIEKQISTIQFAEWMGTSVEEINKLLTGVLAINQPVSSKLESLLGTPSSFWMNRESQYRQDLIRIRTHEAAWMKSLPLKDMIKLGWITEEAKANVRQCLKYFDVPDVYSWYRKYDAELAIAAFRTSESFTPQPASVASWLRQGEIQSSQVVCKKWNPMLFKEALKEIKLLTRIKAPQEFLPKLKSICAECGVAVAIVRTPGGCQASGVTKFLTPDRALLMLSFRFLTDDHFWFTFFHEAGHLLLHGNKAVFIEKVSKDQFESTEEREANNFAAEQLVPSELRPKLMSLPVSNKRAIVGFASLSGVSPGIIIGQLQHLGRVAHNRLNSYKRRFTWECIQDC